MNDKFPISLNQFFIPNCITIHYIVYIIIIFTYHNTLIMTNNKKIMATLAILPLFFGIMIGMSIQASDAQMSGGITDPRLGAQTPKSYGSATAGIVCGDRLCNEATPAFDVEENHEITLIDEHDESTPTAKLIDIRKYKPSTNKGDAITYIITYSITAGTERLENIQVHVSSDVTQETYNIGSLDSFKTSKNVARIMALDADSIDGGIVSYVVAPPTYNPQNPNP